MYRRFHVDKLMCRVITTYSGLATQWLPNDKVNRSELGAASAVLAAHQSGIYSDVILVKGINWAEPQTGSSFAICQ